MLSPCNIRFTPHKFIVEGIIVHTSTDLFPPTFSPSRAVWCLSTTGDPAEYLSSFDCLRGAGRRRASLKMNVSEEKNRWLQQWNIFSGDPTMTSGTSQSAMI